MKNEPIKSQKNKKKVIIQEWILQR